MKFRYLFIWLTRALRHRRGSRSSTQALNVVANFSQSYDCYGLTAQVLADLLKNQGLIAARPIMTPAAPVFRTAVVCDVTLPFAKTGQLTVYGMCNEIVMHAAMIHFLDGTTVQAQ